VASHDKRRRRDNSNTRKFDQGRGRFQENKGKKVIDPMEKVTGTPNLALLIRRWK